MSFETELENFSAELGDVVQGTDKRIISELGNAERGCFTNARGDAEKFVDCMMKATKRIEKEEKKLEFKLAFFQNQVYNCFKTAYEKKTGYDNCKSEAKTNIQKYLDDFVKNVKN